MKTLFIIIVLSVPLRICSSKLICNDYTCGKDCVVFGTWSVCCNTASCNISSGYCDVNCSQTLNFSSFLYPSFKCYQLCTKTTSSSTVTSTSTSTSKAVIFSANSISSSSSNNINLNDSKSTFVTTSTYTTITDRVTNYNSTTTESFSIMTSAALKKNQLDALSKK